MHASHSMHRLAVNTVCKSQFRQRSTSVSRLLGAEAELHFDVELLEAVLEVDVRHDPPRRGLVVIAVAPLVNTHFRAREVHAAR